MGACGRAKADGLKYLWCDTICIDKSSSAELSEAINSMYAWYHDSAVCYAYLTDVDTSARVWAVPGGSIDPVPFEKSRWLTRGWTLQELLAPKKVVFFDRMWNVLGDRKDLADIISRTTRIHVGALHDRNTVREYSIAQRMSWAADRRTSRQEDVAYSLLGIFCVNMPLVYGEGGKAFIRLQEEIIKVSDDQSILAWDIHGWEAKSWSGALAPVPTAFMKCGSIVRDQTIQLGPWSTSNLGLSINLPVVHTSVRHLVLAALNCARELRTYGSQYTTSRRFQVWIALRQTENNGFTRSHEPLSRIYLQDSYNLLYPSTLMYLLLALESSRVRPRRHLEPRRDPFPGISCTLVSGCLVLISSGFVEPKYHVLREVFPFADIITACLSPRSKSSLSHQLIHSSNYSIIFSVLWDKTRTPIDWLYTTFFDQGFRKLHMLASQKEWDCLFHAQESLSRTSFNLQEIHYRLNQATREVLNSHAEDLSPLVRVSDQSFKDLNGDPEIVMEVTFRKPQGPAS